MRHVLTAVDGSEPSGRAVELATVIASRLGATLDLVCAVPPADYPAEVYGVAYHGFEELVIRWAEGMLAELQERCLQRGIRASTRVVPGDPSETILRLAQDEQIDLVVLASLGRKAPARVLLGSVTDRVVHACKKPVLVVH